MNEAGIRLFASLCLVSTTQLSSASRSAATDQILLLGMGVYGCPAASGRQLPRPCLHGPPFPISDMRVAALVLCVLCLSVPFFALAEEGHGSHGSSLAQKLQSYLKKVRGPIWHMRTLEPVRPFENLRI